MQMHCYVTVVLCRSPSEGDECPPDLDPFFLFLTLLDKTGWSYSLLLDFLMSPETCFLLYLVRTLKQISRHWSRWSDVCGSHMTPRQGRSICKAEGDYLSFAGGKGLHSSRRKRKYGSDKQEALSLVSGGNSSDVIGGEMSGHLVESVAVSAAIGTPHGCKNSIVDYSSSSEDDGDGSILSKASVKKSHKVLTENCRIDEYGEQSFYRCRSSEKSSSGCDVKRGRNPTLVRAMAVLRELESVISRLVANDVFPFNIEPLIKHLRFCDTLYTAAN